MAFLISFLIGTFAFAGVSFAQAVYPPGTFSIGGIPIQCGAVYFIEDPNLNDVGIADGKGRIFLNPRILSQLPQELRLYWAAHECGHYMVGANESAADCWAIKTGYAQGWFPVYAFEALTEMFANNYGDLTHPPGPARVAHMKQCYVDAGGDLIEQEIDLDADGDASIPFDVSGVCERIESFFAQPTFPPEGSPPSFECEVNSLDHEWITSNVTCIHGSTPADAYDKIEPLVGEIRSCLAHRANEEWSEDSTIETEGGYFIEQYVFSESAELEVVVTLYHDDDGAEVTFDSRLRN